MKSSTPSSNSPAPGYSLVILRRVSCIPSEFSHHPSQCPRAELSICNPVRQDKDPGLQGNNPIGSCLFSWFRSHLWIEGKVLAQFPGAAEASAFGSYTSPSGQALGHYDVRRALTEQLALRRRCVNRRPFIERELFLLVDLLAGVASSCDTGKTLLSGTSVQAPSDTGVCRPPFSLEGRWDMETSRAWAVGCVHDGQSWSPALMKGPWL